MSGAYIGTCDCYMQVYMYFPKMSENSLIVMLTCRYWTFMLWRGGGGYAMQEQQRGHRFWFCCPRPRVRTNRPES
jgi:hypothetical protein